MPIFDLRPDNTALLLIDVQERFLPAIPQIDVENACGRNCRILLVAAELLHLPIIISEQYVKGLGPTLPDLLVAAPSATRLEKLHFSCVEDAPLANHLRSLDREHVVVCGIETHVCVLATCVDLIAQGRRVVVAGDAVASRNPISRELALSAMRDLGALVVPTESIVFRLQRQAGIGHFKALSQLVR